MRLQERATRFFCVTVSAFLGLALCLVGCGGANPVNAPSIEAIADQIVDVGGQVKVEVILIDADSEEIYALRVSSDHTGVALASLNGAILTLTGVAVGTATITVSATDASGPQGNEVTFEVIVVKPVAPTVAHEREALVALYEATDGPNWTMNTNWLTDHGLAWHGVRVIDGHVTELDLQANGLSGELPDALGNLSNLEYLHLGTNNLSDGIPDALGNLSSLEYLSLDFNALSGEIPSSLGNLSNLETLGLGDNALSGEIPSSLGNLSNLETLNLDFNDLSGEIPSSLGNLSNLERLQLWGNGLSGEIPLSLSNLSNLEGLYLGDNDLSGGIPGALGNLSNLKYLFLSRNCLSGEIPSSLGNLSNLETLNLLGNDLLGGIPSSLGNLSNLETLNLSFNDLSSGIPSSLGNLSNLETLDLYLNDLSGEIPSSLGNLSSLTRLRFTYNRSLTGPLPQSLTKLLRLETFWFDDTGLCAPVDADFQSWLDGIDSARGVDCP